MTTLPNGCSCSKIAVFPKCWDKAGAKTDKPWKIYYRFYDPTFPKPKFIEIKAGINNFKDIRDRRSAVRTLINEEYEKLKYKGFNPITKIYAVEQEVIYEIDPSTPCIKAMRKAITKLYVVKATREDMASALNSIEKAAQQLRFHILPIKDISRKHIKMILERCQQNKPGWSTGSYNRYRAYMMMMFKELVELEAVTANPVRDVSKKKVFKKLRAVEIDRSGLLLVYFEA